MRAAPRSLSGPAHARLTRPPSPLDTQAAQSMACPHTRGPSNTHRHQFFEPRLGRFQRRHVGRQGGAFAAGRPLQLECAARPEGDEDGDERHCGGVRVRWAGWSWRARARGWAHRREEPRNEGRPTRPRRKLHSLLSSTHSTPTPPPAPATPPRGRGRSRRWRHLTWQQFFPFTVFLPVLAVAALPRNCVREHAPTARPVERLQPVPRRDQRRRDRRQLVRVEGR
jgi:hypothetical protein